MAAIASVANSAACAQGGISMAGADELERQAAANLEAVKRYVAAWRAADRAALQDCYHEEFTLHYFGRNPLAGDHVGKTAALKVLAEVSRRTNRKLLDIIDVMAGANRALIIAREAFERGPLRSELDRVLVYSVKDSKLHHCWVYDGDQSLVDQFLAD
jgi:uncharacterized protein